MSETRHNTKSWDKSLLDKQISLLGRLIEDACALKEINKARSALRVLEAITRRLLFTLAAMAPALKPRAPTYLSPTKRLHLANLKPAHTTKRLFKLTESFAFSSALAKLGAPRDKSPRTTRVSIGGLGLAIHYQPTQTPPGTLTGIAPPTPTGTPPLTSWDKITLRLDALKDVAARTDHHINRLRRWQARQEGRAQLGQFYRHTPLLPGRPRQLVAGDFFNMAQRPSDPAQQLLHESYLLASAASRDLPDGLP